MGLRVKRLCHTLAKKKLVPIQKQISGDTKAGCDVGKEALLISCEETDFSSE
jgi:hypothetical protein